MKKITKPFLFFLAFVPGILIAQKSTTAIQTGADVAVVQTNSGKVRGYIHNGIFTYKGIPYAQAKRDSRLKSQLPGKPFAVR